MLPCSRYCHTPPRSYRIRLQPSTSWLRRWSHLSIRKPIQPESFISKFDNNTTTASTIHPHLAFCHTPSQLYQARIIPGPRAIPKSLPTRIQCYHLTLPKLHVLLEKYLELYASSKMLWRYGLIYTLILIFGCQQEGSELQMQIRILNRKIHKITGKSV
jgi:hypothetical protein